MTKILRLQGIQDFLRCKPRMAPVTPKGTSIALPRITSFKRRPEKRASWVEGAIHGQWLYV